MDKREPVAYWNCETQQIEMYVESESGIVYDNGVITIIPSEE